ncbi:MAG: hypothetical protein JRG96_02585 [Deltaproteobacteria bacterium]|nr:hypothetical protein [Deltaproteobacteria bacterium]MBW2419144.1 hypothetical protein [Deltaproteobacteria bacterium]
MRLPAPGSISASGLALFLTLSSLTVWPLTLWSLTVWPAPALAGGPPPTAATSCRDSLLRYIDWDCDATNPCPQPDIVAADDFCAQALLDDPGDQESRFFRSLTRVMRRFEEDHPDGLPARESIQGLLDSFGFDTDGNADQYGLTEDGRSILDFSTDPPRGSDPNLLGKGDGSIGEPDPFLVVYLTEGDYLLAVAASWVWVDEVIAGESDWGNLYSVESDGGGGWTREDHDHGDYEITISGDATVSNTSFAGTLNRIDPGVDNRTTIDTIAFTVESAGEVRIDVLSWEQEGPEWPPDGAPNDVNGDGESAFMDAYIMLFRDDGLLDESDFVSDDSWGDADDYLDLPSDSPSGADLQYSLLSASDGRSLLSAIDGSVADLALIDDSIAVLLTENSLPLVDVDPGNATEIDYGDIELYRAVLLITKAQLLLVGAFDVDIDIDDFTPMLRTLAIQVEILDGNPALLDLTSGAHAKLQNANAASRDAVDAYLAASAFIRAESDSQHNDFFTISRDDLALEAEFRHQLAAFQRSFSGATALFCQRSYVDGGLDYLNDYLGTGFDERGVGVHLGALYGSSAGDLRDLLPTIQYDPTHAPKNWVPRADPVSEFPDPTFNGVLLPLSAAYDCDGDGISDDGDGSGVAGDLPCMGGNLSNCDDNAPHTPNGPGGGTCTAGDAGGVDGICAVNADCGTGGQCSLAQDDTDSDGVGDAIDNCSLDSNPGQSDLELCTIVNPEGSFDEFEPGVGIETNYGPLEGEWLEFACGACEGNDFSATADRIGNQEEFCGHTSAIPNQIISNGDLVCARNVFNHRTWEIQLLSHRGGRGCFDADEGESCAAAGGETSYIRHAGDGVGDACDANPAVPVSMPSLAIACPEPATALLQIASLAALVAARRLAKRRHSATRN